MSLRFLVVEDDPASREFARSSLSPFGIVDTARTLLDAGTQCAQQRYDLLLLDVSLPDGKGDGWLTQQRAIGNGAPAVALTADLDADRRQHLLASGFVEALAKPLSDIDLRRALAPWLGQPVAAWDDTKALAALGGSDATLRRMRQLFIDELPRQRERVETALAANDVSALRAVLHQMRAGCGFVGAAALSEAVDTLHAEPADRTAAATLRARIDEALARTAL